MNNGAASPAACGDLHSFVRNRYFYGKLLDVGNFESEQAYFNHKRWLINRLVSGYGVIWGQGVRLTDDNRHVEVQPGVAFDKAGREIVVPTVSAPIAVPNSPAPVQRVPVDGKTGAADTAPKCDEDERQVSSLWICYHECPIQPERSTAPECGAPPACPAGSIRESYTLEIRPCPVQPIDLKCEIPEAIGGGQLNYSVLAEYVSANFPAVPGDCCIPLANICLPFEGTALSEDDIDITIRPIVYSNDLLFEMVLGLLAANQPRPKGGKN